MNQNLIQRWQTIVKLCLSTLLSGMLCSCAQNGAKAESITTPRGDAPMVHWAILESAPGEMPQMQRLARELVAPRVANEPGTYALYGGVDASNPNLLFLLEIYRDEEAYELHVGSQEFCEYRTRRKPILKELLIAPVEPIALEQKLGEGSEVWASLVVVSKENADEFRELLRSEASAAVQRNDRLLAFFATAALDGQTFRILQVFRNAEDRLLYRASSEYREFRRHADALELRREEWKLNVGKLPISAKYKEDRL